MTNKQSDSTAAEQFLVTTKTNGDNPPYLKYAVSNGSVAYGYCYNETDAQKIVDALNNTIESAKEAQWFAEWIANNDYEWSHRAVNPRLWTRGLDEDLSFTTEELYQLYKEGKG